MQETWLLFDEIAVRTAAGNPRGSQQLQFPMINKLEQLPDPKEILHKLLREASGLTGRRLKQFSVHERVHRVSELIDDFSHCALCLPFKLSKLTSNKLFKNKVGSLYIENK